MQNPGYVAIAVVSVICVREWCLDVPDTCAGLLQEIKYVDEKRRDVWVGIYTFGNNETIT